MLLALVLLSGLIPSGVLSATRLCRMACCAGKPPHEAGSCNALLASAEQDEAATEAAESHQHSSSHQAAQPATETVEASPSSDHCQTTAHHATEHHQAAEPEPGQRAGVRGALLDKPCSADCLSAALNPAQLRRPRESAAHSMLVRLRPSALIVRADTPSGRSPSSIAHQRQSSPRAPPAFLVASFA